TNRSRRPHPWFIINPPDQERQGICQPPPIKNSGTYPYPNTLIAWSPSPNGRPGLRSTMHIEISGPADSLSPSHGERAGERGRDYTGNGADSPLPSDGRGVRGEGSPALDSQPILDFISSDETL